MAYMVEWNRSMVGVGEVVAGVVVLPLPINPTRHTTTKVT